MCMDKSRLENFYRMMLEKGPLLGDIPAAPEIQPVVGFPQVCDTFGEIPAADCSYPAWEGAAAESLFLVPAAEPVYPAGFDGGGQLPDIFGGKKQTTGKPFSMASLPLPSNSERISAFVRQRCVLEAAAHSLISELYAEFLTFDGQEYPELERIQSPILSRTLSQSGFPIQSYRTAKERGYRGIRLKQELDPS